MHLLSGAGRFAGCTARRVAHPPGPGNGMWRHGGRSAETTLIRQLGAELARMARDVLGAVAVGTVLGPSLTLPASVKGGGSR